MSLDDRCVQCRRPLDYPNTRFCSRCGGDILTTKELSALAYHQDGVNIVVASSSSPFIQVYKKGMLMPATPREGHLVRVHECLTCGANMKGGYKCEYCGNQYVQYSIQPFTEDT